MKKVLFIVIDALATRIVEPAMRQGKLPNLAKLVEAGTMRPRCTAVFPSITPAATASLITGKYPREHQIAGNYWYDTKEDRIAYHGDDFWAVLNKGLGAFFHDFVIALNFDRLKQNTLFETVERHGLHAACINFMWIRGDEPHKLRAPLLLRLLPGVEFPDQIAGPKTLLLGDFVADAPQEEFTAPGGVTRRFGFDDESTSAYLLGLARAQALPDFTLAYFPNNDFESHDEGPADAVTILERIDGTLGELFDVWGGHHEMLDEFAVLITGDHSQSDLEEDADHRSIALDEVLDGFQLAKAGQTWKDNDELMACPNMRTVQIYLRRQDLEVRERVVECLLAERRVDQVIWDDRGERNGGDAVPHWFVSTADRGRLEFWSGGDDDTCVADVHGNHWCYRGDLAAVDAKDEGGSISFTTYPNAFERIANSPGEVGGDIWATARVGHEFRLPATEVHERGSHGSLHELDSTSPLIVAGLPEGVAVPAEPRSTDVASICLSVLGVPEE